MAKDPKEEAERVEGPRGEAFVLPPDRRGVGKKVPRGQEQYHGFWRVVYYPHGERSLSAPEILRAEDENDAHRAAERAVQDGFAAAAGKSRG